MAGAARRRGASVDRFRGAPRGLSGQKEGRLVIREADLGQPADAEALVGLIDADARDLMGGGAPLTPAVRARLVPNLREVPGRLVLLAFEGERAVGVAVCFPGFSTFHARPLINIHDLAVLPGSRGRGVGRALLGAVVVGMFAGLYPAWRAAGMRPVEAIRETQ